MDRLIEKLPVSATVRKHLLIVYYFLQILLVLIYLEPEIQPFVYVRF